MKTIGLLGGMSWESTLTYYQVLNRAAKRELGGLHSAQCIVYSVDFEPIERYQMCDDWDAAGRVLREGAAALQCAGAEAVVLCTNTMHKVAPCIEAGISVPFLHIADATAAELLGKNVHKAVLLGTRYTMEQDFIRERLEGRGIEVMVPEKHERDEINRIIFEELCLGEIRGQSKQYLLQVIERLQALGGEGVVLGCTELGLLVGGQDCSIPVVDTALAHAETAARWMLEIEN